MRLSSEDLRKAFIALSFGLEPAIFAIVGWYVAPYLNFGNTAGALIGALIGFGMMFWRVWKFGLAVELKAKYDFESADLRSLVSLIEVERYKIIGKHDLMKIIGARGPLQILNVLKGISLLNKNFYDVNEVDNVIDEVTDFSKIMAEMHTRSPVELIRVLNAFNDFLTLLCSNYAFRYEVYGDEVAKGLVIPPFRRSIGLRDFLSINLKDFLTQSEVRELYPKALNEALSLNSRAPLLALAAYSLALMAECLEKLSYGRAYSVEVGEIAAKLYAIAVYDLERTSRKTGVVKLFEKHKVLGKAPKAVEGLQEEEVLRSFIASSYEALMMPGKLPLKAKTVISYLFVKWSEKVSLNLAFMAAREEIGPQEAYASLLVPC